MRAGKSVRRPLKGEVPRIDLSSKYLWFQVAENRVAEMEIDIVGILDNLNYSNERKETKHHVLG